MTDLEQLSRDAAGCLLATDFELSKQLGLFTGDTTDTPLLGKQLLSFNADEETGELLTCWLHESTEACSDIETLVLWPAGWAVRGSDQWAEAYKPGERSQYHIVRFDAVDGDRKLARRIVTLRALVAMKGKQT